MGRKSAAQRQADALSTLAVQASEHLTVAIATWLEFVNFKPSERPWSELAWPLNWRAIHGDPPFDTNNPHDPYWVVDELHGNELADAPSVARGEYRLAVWHQITTRWAQDHSGRVLTIPPEDDLAEYFLWTKLMLMHSGAWEYIGQCGGLRFRSHQRIFGGCGKFFHGSQRNQSSCASSACLKSIQRASKRRNESDR